MTTSTKPHEKPRIGITLGDLHGIGPEVVIKALADSRITSLLTPVVYGSSRVLSYYKKLLNIEDFNFSTVRNKGQYTARHVNAVNCWEETIEITPGKPSNEAGDAALKALRSACDDLKSGLIDALVTGPIDKHTAHSEQFPFRGHTEYLTAEFGQGESLMFMVSDVLRVGLVTDHEPLKGVAPLITPQRIEAKLRLLEESLQKDFGIQKPRIAVLGLNPHAGDGGLIGTEDEEIIRSVVSAQRNKGKLIFGPIPADGFFGNSQYLRYDAVLAMYHDQGLIPFKTLAFDSGVNFTAGLPIVRTSPDHGTAYNIAGKNLASEHSMRASIFAAADIYRRRIEPPKEK